jgi:hypothetical protein
MPAHMMGLLPKSWSVEFDVKVADFARIVGLELNEKTFSERPAGNQKLSRLPNQARAFAELGSCIRMLVYLFKIVSRSVTQGKTQTVFGEHFLTFSPLQQVRNWNLSCSLRRRMNKSVEIMSDLSEQERDSTAVLQHAGRHRRAT